MAILSRRRIQTMLDDLSRHLDQDKRKDLVNRLNDKRVEQSLPAEMELTLIWTLRNLDLEIEPMWWANGKKPDAYVEGLLPSSPAVIEITAVADNSMSGEPQMDHCARQLINVANASQRGSGDYLYFHFAETRTYFRGRNERGIAAPKNYVPSEETKAFINEWLESNPDMGDRLRIEDGKLRVDVEKREHKQIRYHNFHVSRPPRAYSDTRNPIYQALSKKSSQVADAPEGTWKIIFLAEAGSRLLSNVSDLSNLYSVERHSTARNIISKFISDKKGKVDAVVVFIPIKKYNPGFLSSARYDKKWGVTVFGEENAKNIELLKSLNMLIKQLPKPNFDGFNARSLTRQGAMEPSARGWYLPTSMTFKDNKLTYRMSLRAFQDFLARRISEDKFRNFIGDNDDGPSIGHFLKQGYTIKNVRFESGGIDQDDDHVILEFAEDAAASLFK